MIHQDIELSAEEIAHYANQLRNIYKNHFLPEDYNCLIDYEIDDVKRMVAYLQANLKHLKSDSENQRALVLAKLNQFESKRFENIRRLFNSDMKCVQAYKLSAEVLSTDVNRKIQSILDEKIHDFIIKEIKDFSAYYGLKRRRSDIYRQAQSELESGQKLRKENIAGYSQCKSIEDIKKLIHPDLSFFRKAKNKQSSNRAPNAYKMI